MSTRTTDEEWLARMPVREVKEAYADAELQCQNFSHDGTRDGVFASWRRRADILAWGLREHDRLTA